MSFTFSKQERLTSLKHIGQLFNRKAAFSFSAFPLRMVVEPALLPPGVPAQVLISVPKRNFKSAPARNRLKRLMREAWRLNKHQFYQTLNVKKVKAVILLQWIAADERPFAEVQAALQKLHTHAARQPLAMPHAESPAD